MNSNVTKARRSSTIVSTEFYGSIREHLNMSPMQLLIKDKHNFRNLIAMCTVWTVGSFGSYLINTQIKYL